MIKRTVAFFALLVLLFFSLTSCTSEKTFSYAELSIVLDSSFEELSSEQYDLVLEGDGMNVGLKRISLLAAVESGIPDTYSPERFAEYFLSKRGEDAEIFTYGDIPYFSLYESVSGVEFYTLYTFYRSKYAYFIITFAAERQDEGKFREKFFEYANSVYFTS